MRNSASIIALAMAAFAAPAQAQDENPDDASNREIIVTAEKVAQSVQDVPLSVTVIDEKKLQEMGAESFTDYAVTVPGLSFVSLAPGEQRVVLRGVVDSVEDLRGEAQNVTGIYIDEMVVSNNLSAPDLNLFDVNRVEVLRGPQGTLYGDGSVGGLIRVITNKANVNKFEGAAQGTLGFTRHGGTDIGLNAMINAPLVQDKLGLRLVAQYRDADGFIDDVVRGVDNVNSLKQWGLRGSLRWEPTANFALTASALLQRTDLGGRFDYHPELGDLKRGKIYAEPIDTDFDLFNMTAEWDAGPFDVVSSSSYGLYKRTQASDFTNLVHYELKAPLPSLGLFSHKSKSFSQELRLVSPAKKSFRWLAGLYYHSFDERSREFDVTEGLTDLLGLRGTPFDIGEDVIFESNTRRRRKQIAAFGELSFDLTDSLTATGGIRWFRDKVRTDENAAGVVLGSPRFIGDATNVDDGVVFRFRLAQQFNEDVLVYALASQGYRTGGINPLNPFTINDPAFAKTFDSDSLWNYEVGWKTSFANDRIFFNGAAYLINWKNVQVQKSLDSGFTVVTNADDARIKGLEAEFVFYPLDNLEIGLSGSLQDATIRTDSVELEAKAGDSLPGVPKHQASTFVQWTFPVGNAVEGVFRADASYMGRMRRTFGEDADTYGNYTLINMRVGLEYDDLSATLFVNNLTDRRAPLFRAIEFPGSAQELESVNVATPRTFGITIAKNF